MSYAGVVVKAIAMVFFQTLGTVKPRVRGQGFLPRDAILNLINGVGLFALKLLVLNAALRWLDVGLVDLSWLPSGPAQFVFALVVLDFTRYWVHYADHRVPWLWTFHRVHHSAETLDSTTGLRMHLVDFLQLSCLPALTFGLIFNGHQLAPWVLPAAMAVADVFDAFEHSNTPWPATNPLARLWGKFFNNPLFHSWHHTRDGELCDGNYGNTLVIWDRMFGTDVTQAEPPPLLGLSADQAIEDQSLLGWQLLRRRRSADKPAAV